ncbi:Helicase associated domain protein [Lentzea sp. NPDC042327]|uniref:DEAD/DEAH box helicase n=1 Tax=Lentzea sp. NPDC042327 TaxID=3154801 RepID=UPI0033C44BF9
MSAGVRKVPRPYQATAVADTAAHLRHGGHAQAHMACGAGKTLVALWVGERTTPGDAVIVVLVPTIALVAQLLAEWRTNATLAFSALAVCSDDTVVDAPVHVQDLHVDSTTDPERVAAWLGATPGRRCVFGTYASAHVVHAALTEHRMRADLLVCDEAHHLTGAVEASTRRVLDPGFLPAARRLFATATPRFDMRITSTVDKIGMDDEAVFGPRTAYYPFHQAIADGHLKDYRVAVIGVSEAEMRTLLTDSSTRYLEGYGAAELRTLATQVALAKAKTMFGFRRVISFHHRVAEAAEFARTLEGTLRRLPAEQRPGGELYAGHVHGEQTVTQRNLVLKHLHHPPDDGWTVVSNARCLGEGVDVPAVDAIAFGHPKSSPVDIVQAAGRALRRHDDGTAAPQGTATIVVPIIVPHDQGEVTELDPREYSVLWNVVRALRAHDDELGIALDRHRAGLLAPEDERRLRDKITVVLPPGTADHVLTRLSVLLVRQTTSPWWESYGAAVRFHAAHGHLMPPRSWRDRHSSTPLSQWLGQQRVAERRGDLRPDRRALLDRLDMVWDPGQEQWADPLAAATAFRDEHNHLRVPKDYITPADHPVPGFPLGQRLQGWIHRHRYGLLGEHASAALEALGIEWNDHITDPFEHALAHAHRYHAKYGDLRVPQDYVTSDGFRLGSWLSRQRGKRTRGQLSCEQIAALDELGIVWEPELERWHRGLTAAGLYRAEHGHLRVPKDYLTPADHPVPGFPLGAWLGSRRVEHGKGTLEPDHAAALDALGMVWNIRDAAWEDNFAVAERFYHDHGHLDVPHRYRDPVTGALLGSWLLHQRQLRNGVKPGGLSPDKIDRLDKIGMVWANKKRRARRTP